MTPARTATTVAGKVQITWMERPGVPSPVTPARIASARATRTRNCRLGALACLNSFCTHVAVVSPWLISLADEVAHASRSRWRVPEQRFRARLVVIVLASGTLQVSYMGQGSQS